MKKIVFTLALLFTVNFIWAQKIEEKQELKGEPSTALAALNLASDLVKYGYAQKSALPLVNALQIIVDNPTIQLEAKREGETVNVSKQEGKAGYVALDFDEILASAKKFADGDKKLLKLIAKVKADSKKVSREAVGGPKYASSKVNSKSTDKYTIAFYANRLAEVAVTGDGDTDLDLYVYDANGNLIVSDTDYTDKCYVCWTPAWTGSFTIKIVNRGNVYNKYVLLTN